jgi:hypothetical protein
MIAVLQWTTLAVCGAVAVARIPSALRGENRSLFYILTLMTVAILLSIDAPYVVIDQALGGMNLANLLLRFVIFGAIFVLGVRITRGFSAEGAYRRITGKAGMVVLLVISAVLVTVFFLMDTEGSSAGLIGPARLDARNALLVEYYGAAGRAYPAYVSIALLPAMLRAAAGTLPALIRVAAGLLALGGIAITVSLFFPAFPASWEAVKFVVNYTAVLCFVIGLALIWAGRVRGSGRTSPLRTYTEK